MRYYALHIFKKVYGWDISTLVIYTACATPVIYNVFFKDKHLDTLYIFCGCALQTYLPNRCLFLSHTDTKSYFIPVVVHVRLLKNVGRLLLACAEPSPSPHSPLTLRPRYMSAVLGSTFIWSFFSTCMAAKICPHEIAILHRSAFL